MAEVIYKRGSSQNLDSVDVQDGQILVTDKGEMYIDFLPNGRKKITDTSKQDKLKTYSELIQNNNTTAQISADALELIGRTLATEKRTYDITYEGGTGQKTDVIYNFSYKSSDTIYHDQFGEVEYQEFMYTNNSDAVIDLPVGTKFKLELNEDYYINHEDERQQALERLEIGWGSRQQLKLVAYVNVKSNNIAGVGLSMNVNGLHFASIPSSYQYDIKLIGNASHRFMEGVVSNITEFTNFEQEVQINVVLDDGTEADVTLIIPATDNNLYLPEISKILVPGTRIHLSHTSKSICDDATLSFTLEMPNDSICLKNIATPIEDTDAVNKAYVDALDDVLRGILNAIRGGETTGQTVAQIEQLITNYLETKTVAEVEK